MAYTEADLPQIAQLSQPSTASSPILIAISGPTSTGKTTLTHALLHILPPASFPNPTIIHADDFYLPDSQIPVREEDGLQDWDCAEAVDWERFWKVLEHVKAGGEVPADLVRQGGLGDGEEGDGVHAPSSAGQKKKKRGISAATLTTLRHQILTTWPPSLLHPPRRLILIEGFLLFGRTPYPHAHQTFDIRVLLRTTRAVAKQRREGRNGYVTLEGFWQDPPGYFEKVVWPGFVREHERFFEGENVEGRVVQGGGEGGMGRGVVVQDVDGEGSVEGALRWLVGVLRGEVGRVVESRERERDRGK